MHFRLQLQAMSQQLRDAPTLLIARLACQRFKAINVVILTNATAHCAPLTLEGADSLLPVITGDMGNQQAPGTATVGKLTCCTRLMSQYNAWYVRADLSVICDAITRCAPVTVQIAGSLLPLLRSNLSHNRSL